MRVAVLSFLALWAGMTLLLTHVRWFARRPLIERLQPYSPTLDRARPRGTVLSVDSFRDVIGPIVSSCSGPSTMRVRTGPDAATFWSFGRRSFTV